ncbi:hypothetical protein OEZ85_000411 [Tetradesmus obliquus]|uniref:ceramide glucosyltransferase n=1 Tax=Tetradesmus obliquus TaxID=3088 RepID=A0ABY8UQK3_TETOB|nr:hypothetical protein OEZ85_000411 [Tetradesmus obliquus]
MAQLPLLLLSLVNALRHPLVQAIQLQASFVLLVGTAPWPPLAVVCPVKGCRQHSSANWASQLAAHYGGPRVFVFVVESAADPAVAALQDMLSEQQQQQQGGKQQQQQQDMLSEQQQQGGKQQQQQQDGKQQQQQQQQQVFTSGLPGCVLHAAQQGPGQWVLLVDAGLAQSCSQKIHNVLGGIEVALAAMQQMQQQQQPVLQGHQQQQQQPDHDQQHHNTLHPSSSSTTTWGSGSLDSSSSNSSSSSSGYVAVLDDDVALHPLSLCQLVDEMEADPQLFMATGYPFDLVAAPSSSSGGSSSTGSSGSDSSSSSWWGRLLAYAAASYHLPLLIGFSVADRGGFVWGGVMMLRADELRKAAAEGAAAKQAAGAAGGGLSSKPNILQVWRQGGYSDDLLLAAFCTEHGLPIGMPASAYFPQQLPATYTAKQYWNYLRRQLYVLDTYATPRNKTLNHGMMLAHSYGSAVFTAAAAATSLQLLLLLLLAAAGPALCMQYMVRQVLRLFRVLSPGASDEVLRPQLNLALLWLGWVLENALLPFCMAYCYFCDRIMWGGIMYHKAGGRVRRVVHPGQQ